MRKRFGTLFAQRGAERLCPGRSYSATMIMRSIPPAEVKGGGGDDDRVQGVQPTNTDAAEDELRRRAVKRLRAKAGFWTHLAVYLAVNGFLVLIWFFTGAGFFWPIFPIAGWGIGIAANAWDAYGREPVTQERIQREMEHLRR